MAQFEISFGPVGPSIKPAEHVVDVGDTVVWSVTGGAAVVKFVGSPSPVYFVKSEAQPDSPAIAIAAVAKQTREFDVTSTVIAADSGGAGGAVAAEREQPAASASARTATIMEIGPQTIRARLIIR